MPSPGHTLSGPKLQSHPCPPSLCLRAVTKRGPVVQAQRVPCEAQAQLQPTGRRKHLGDLSGTDNPRDAKQSSHLI